MTKRERRLQKGIDSLQKQVKIHEEKLAEAMEIGDEYLSDYYTKEVDELKKRTENRKSKLHRKGK